MFEQFKGDGTADPELADAAGDTSFAADLQASYGRDVYATLTVGTAADTK